MNNKFNYAGKLFEEIFLMLFGIGLSLFMLYELFVSEKA